jgi:ABC-type bacteriocin/lantibiotic exporter with double-glycine peptidase domain
MFRFAAGVCLIGLCLLSALRSAETSAVWIDVPFVKQEPNRCGAAAVAMLMRYWEREADPQTISQVLYSQKVQGISGADVERFLRESGFRTFVFRGEWQDLEQHLAKGRPLMVCLRPGHAAPLHYVVVAGVDASQGVVFVNDPARRKLLKVERGTFEKDWNAANGWTLLALPQQLR